MKSRYSKTLLLALGLAAGLLLREPAAGSAEVLTGRVLAVDREHNQLTLQPAPDTQAGVTALTVRYTIPGSGNNPSPGLPACIQPGKVVQVQGRYTNKQQTGFAASDIHGLQPAGARDATGVRARLGSCRRSR